MNREQLVRLAREAVAGINRPSYCHNPPAFDPHEWVLDAMLLAYRTGHPAPSAASAVPTSRCSECGCTDLDCGQCIERTGRPCSWATDAQDLCTACERRPRIHLVARELVDATSDGEPSELEVLAKTIAGEVLVLVQERDRERRRADAHAAARAPRHIGGAPEVAHEIYMLGYADGGAVLASSRGHSEREGLAWSKLASIYEELRRLSDSAATEPVGPTLSLPPPIGGLIHLAPEVATALEMFTAAARAAHAAQLAAAAAAPAYAAATAKLSELAAAEDETSDASRPGEAWLGFRAAARAARQKQLDAQAAAQAYAQAVQRLSEAVVAEQTGGEQ